MKNIFKYALILTMALGFVSCEEDLIEFDPVNGQTAVSFARTAYNVSIPVENLTLEIPVDVTTRTNSARSFDVSILSATEGTDSEYSVGTITVPADSHQGILSVDFFYDQISGDDGVVKQVVLKLSDTDDISTYFDEVTIDYFREIVCNDLELEIVSDIFGSETSYEITDADGNVVAGATGIFPGNFCTQLTYTENINLPDGDYTFTIIDSFGDGQFSQNDGCGPDDIIGTYSLTCSIIVHASGGGNWGASESTDFSVNP